MHETDEVRRQAAQNYRTSVKAAKKCFNSVMFGGSISRWEQSWRVSSTAKSEIAEEFEKEMRRARVLIAEQELKRCGARERKSDKTLMAEAVSREEEKILNAQDTAARGEARLEDRDFDPRRDHRPEEE